MRRAGSRPSLQLDERAPSVGNLHGNALLAAQNPYVLRLSPLDPRDPRLDVGILGNQISIPLLAKEMTWKREEFFPVVSELAEVGPDHLVASVGDDVRRLYGLARGASRKSKRSRRACIFRLQEGDPGPGLQAVRSVGTWDQTDSGPGTRWPMPDGITPDGRYFVMIRARVSHPVVPSSA